MKKTKSSRSRRTVAARTAGAKTKTSSKKPPARAKRPAPATAGADKYRQSGAPWWKAYI